MTTDLGVAPLLSTPDTHILNEISPTTILKVDQRASDEDVFIQYEVQRTIDEIKKQKWRRIALQFPDEMLQDSARVFQMLARGLKSAASRKSAPAQGSQPTEKAETELSEGLKDLALSELVVPVKLTILADTSYGSCCIDEIAAEHVDADAVVHYGRACLSPTARLPVIHIFTRRYLELPQVLTSFQETFPDQVSKVILTADVTFANHVDKFCEMLVERGYTNIFAASVIHDPSSPIPNRTVPNAVAQTPDSLKDWHLFHISKPPTSLLLTLSSRMASIHIFPTEKKVSQHLQKSLMTSTSLILRRRYALITSVTTVSIWGILINTLSVKNYLHMLEHVKKEIAAAGKKSYLFVVGKLNAAKLANFSEIGGWVVIGCWESSLIDSKDFYKPIITPFELQIAMKRDDQRVWTGEWRGDFQGVLDDTQLRSEQGERIEESNELPEPDPTTKNLDGDYDSEEESAPPEFDLRTGRYVSHTRPMLVSESSTVGSSKTNSPLQSHALTRRPKGDIVAVNGTASPAAEFLRDKRTWKGLGSDFKVAYEEDGDEDGATIQEGRTGIARGYTVTDSKRT